MVGVRDFRQRIGQHLDDTLRGHPITVTRQGRPIARLIPYQEDPVTEDPAPYRVAPLANQSELTDLALFLADGDKVEAARLLAEAISELLKEKG
jgi:prevent-host-death family protein